MRRKTLARVSVLVASAVVGSLLGAALSSPPPKAEAGSPAKRTAAVAADEPKLEMIPLHPKAVRDAPVVRQKFWDQSQAYRGFTTEPSDDAKDDPGLMAFHKELGRLLAVANPEPPHREQRWGRLFQPGSQYSHKGWHGKIVSTEETPQGVLVKLRVSPHMKMAEGIQSAFTSDYQYETYLIDPQTGGTRFIRWEEDPANKGGAVFIL